MSSFVHYPVPAVESLLNTPIPELLWHYTSLEGLLGIVTTKRIWATDIRYLNDSMEFKDGLAALKRELELIAKEEAGEYNENELLVSIVQAELDSGILAIPKDQEFYVSCFSKNGDQLSQWRGYTPPGKGVSLGFRLSQLRPAPESLASFAPCLYDEAGKADLLRSTFQTFRDATIAWRRVFDEHVTAAFEGGQNIDLKDVPIEIRKPLVDHTHSLTLGLLRLMLFFKHTSFAEEAEWRFFGPLSTATDVSDSRRSLRPGRFTLIPTISAPLSPVEGELPLRKVIIGPSPEQDLSIESVKMLLRLNGLADVEVVASIVPFKSW